MMVLQDDSALERAQRLRMKRTLLASAGSAVTVAIALLTSWSGNLPVEAAEIYALVVAALCAGFYALFRSGLNLGFSDPTLTVPQLVTAGLSISYLLFEGEAARPTFLILFLLAYMFGAFTLDKRRLIGVALFYVACYVGAIGLALVLRPGSVDLRRELFLIVIFGCVMAWMGFLAIYISGLRAHLRQTTAELKRALEHANTLATHDSLTNCYNRRRMLEILELEQRRAKRGAVLSVCLVDLDHFKSINDQHGHAAGDEVLTQFVAVAMKQLRETDALARYGGEEFLIILPAVPLAGALAVAERIRAAVERETFAALPADRRVTISLGVAEHRPAMSIEHTLSRVDTALYEAKRNGRNRVVAAA